MTVDTRRVLALQTGGRRNYAMPRALESAGLLHSFVSDAVWPVGRVPLPIAALASRHARIASAVARRTIRDIPPARVHCSLAATLAGATRMTGPREIGYTRVNDALGRGVSLDQVDVVVNCFGNGGSLLDRARSAGKIIVTDFISHPRHWRILSDERRRWPGWESDCVDPRDTAEYERRIAWLVECSDFYLCPSQSVADALAEVPGFVTERVRIVPYGASGFRTQPAATIPGRILFAASCASLAKGIPYLAAAARRLAEQGRPADIVLAGAVPAGWTDRPELAGLQLLGSLDSTAMATEFARADIFCLPSLAEGSATVVFEAMANGLPIVTTASSGSVICHGEEGLIVPERDSDALADALFAIVSDRSLRDRMAATARQTSARYDEEHCQSMFLAVVREALAMRCGASS